MTRKILVLLLILALLSPAAPAEGPGFTVREVPVRREEPGDETVPLRFYDGMPDYPFMGLTEYYRLMLGKEMSAENLGGGVYRFTAAGGATATVDVNAGAFASDDFMDFTNLMDLIDPGMGPQYLDVPAFTRALGVEADRPAAPVSLDLARYGIPVYGGERDVYLPLATLSDLFVNVAYLFASWNGESVYVNFGNDENPAYLADPNYEAPIFARAERTGAEAEYAYGELCFVIDTFYGHPGRAALDGAIAEKGLDRALAEESDYTRRCRELLRSRKLGEFVCGAEYLNGLLYDGGHTDTYFYGILYEDFAGSDAVADYYFAAEGGSPDYSFLKDYALDYAIGQKLKERRDAAYGGGRYVERGDTAAVWFDSFMYDFAGWDAYYNAGGPRPTDDDMAVVIDALERARRNPEISNFVFDISLNLGGSADMVVAIMSLIADDASFRCDNLLTGQNLRNLYRVDRNFDGAFDGRDDAVRYDFNFGVLTSKQSFSCGNLLPALMKDHGMAVLGEPSGGGACAVELHATPEGLVYQISSGLARLTDAEGGNIDGGIPVDVDLNPDGDYSGFYDFDAIARAMRAYYAAADAA